MNEAPEDVMEPTLWKKSGWIAKVIKNDDDEGWAVEMTRMGDSEPALVGPWVMGRDKKNPKPLSQKDFSTLVKTAGEVLERHVQHARAQLHKTIIVTDRQGVRVRVDLDLIADEQDPHAMLTALDEATSSERASKRVPPSFKLTASSATEFANERANERANEG